jgi:hypothetical protein
MKTFREEIPGIDDYCYFLITPPKSISNIGTNGFYGWFDGYDSDGDIRITIRDYLGSYYLINKEDIEKLSNYIYWDYADFDDDPYEEE